MINTLKFNELHSDVKAQLVEKNRTAYANYHNDSHTELYKESRSKFEDIFCLSAFSSNCTMLDEDLRGVRLATWLINNIYDDLVAPKSYYLEMKNNYKSRQSKIQVDQSCALTGTCTDEIFTQPVFNFIAKPDLKTSLNDLVYECLENARVTLDKWNDDNYSDDEGIADYLLNLDDDYTAEGEVVNQYECAS